MLPRVYSRIALHTLLKLRTCAEAWVAREWTCRKPRSKTHDGPLTKHKITATFLRGLDGEGKDPLSSLNSTCIACPRRPRGGQDRGSTQRRVPSHGSVPRLGTARECLPEAKAVLASNSQLCGAADSSRQAGRLALNQ